MKPIDPEFSVLAEIYKETHKKPTLAQYRKKAKGTNVPTVDELSKKYGSAKAVVHDFFQSYSEHFETIRVHDYILGSFAGRCKLVRRQNGWAYLRYMISDQDQIEAVAKFVHHFSVVSTKKGGSNYEMRIFDHDLMTALDAMNFFEDIPFKPTVDFVRGYCDGHSALRFYNSTGPKKLVRMTLSGSIPVKKQNRI